MHVTLSYSTRITHFKNFVRWIRVPRPLLIQGVPDILTSSDEQCVPERPVYVIGVLGSVNDVHKGRDIVSTVMRLAADCNAKLRFELIGADVADFSGISGVHATGAYANDAVFDLAKSRRVDVWLFVSVFEESYGSGSEHCDADRPAYRLQ